MERGRKSNGERAEGERVGKGEGGLDLDIFVQGPPSS